MFTLSNLKEVVKSRFNMNIEDKDGNENLEDLGFDSLSQLDLAAAINKKYGVKISDSDMPSISTLNDVVDYISNKL